MRFTIGAKLIGLIGFLLLSSELMLVGLSTHLFIQDNTALIQQMNADTALSIGTQVRAYLEGFSERMRLLGDVWIRETKIVDGEESLVRDFFMKNPEFVTLQLVRPLPTLGAELVAEYYAADTHSASPQAISDVWNFSSPDVQILPARLGTAKGLGIALPLSGGRHFIVGWIDLRKLSRPFQAHEMATSFLTDTTGNILASSRSSTELQKLDAGELGGVRKLLTNGLTNGQTRFENVTTGERRLVAFRTVGVGKLVVVTEVPESKAFAAVRRLQIRAILVALVVLFVSFVAGYFYSETIAGPIRELVTAAQQIAQGDFHVSLRARSSDEVGDLSDAFVDMARGLEERDRVKETFAKYHNQELAETLLSGKVRLGGELKEAGILFIDLRDFTALTSKMAPERVVEMLNEYFGYMVGVIRTYGGIVDKYVGDGIMALWGVPLERPDDALRAVRCCLALRDELTRLNAVRISRQQVPLRIGMGLNIGKVIAGNIGSSKKMEYTVVGDAVNVASRLEFATKQYQTDLLVSRSVFEKTNRRFLFEPCQLAKVRGKEEEIQVYRVLGYYDEQGRPVEVVDTFRKRAA